jgi:hypothetical protein
MREKKRERERERVGLVVLGRQSNMKGRKKDEQNDAE